MSYLTVSKTLSTFTQNLIQVIQDGCDLQLSEHTDEDIAKWEKQVKTITGDGTKDISDEASAMARDNVSHHLMTRGMCKADAANLFEQQLKNVIELAETTRKTQHVTWPQLVIVAIVFFVMAACLSYSHDIKERDKQEAMLISFHNTLMEHQPQSTIALSDKGLYDQAITYYTQVIASKPDDDDAYFNRGSAYNDEGLYDQAIADYTQAITFKPDFEEAYCYRGGAYAAKGLHDQAIADYTQAIALRPDYHDAYLDRGRLYFNEALYDQAIADFTQAIVLEPDDFYAYNYRAMSYHVRGEDAQGLPDAEKAVALNTRHAEVYLTRAEIYGMLGQRDKAAADYQTARKLAPKKP